MCDFRVVLGCFMLVLVYFRLFRLCFRSFNNSLRPFGLDEAKLVRLQLGIEVIYCLGLG